MPYVYSTITSPTTYCDYGPPNKNAGHAEIKHKVTIKGGHGLAVMVRGPIVGKTYTPIGVVTEVTDEELAFLEQNTAFQRHVKAGFLIVDNRKRDPEKYVNDMNPKDGSAPLTPKDFEQSEHSTDDTKIFKAKKEGEDAEEPRKAKGKK